MEGDFIKLQKLLPHWVEHNEEHAQKFEEWAEVAQRLGLEDVARRLTTASEFLRKASWELEAASQAMEGRNLA